MLQVKRLKQSINCRVSLLPSRAAVKNCSSYRNKAALELGSVGQVNKSLFIPIKQGQNKLVYLQLGYSSEGVAVTLGIPLPQWQAVDSPRGVHLEQVIKRHNLYKAANLGAGRWLDMPKTSPLWTIVCPKPDVEILTSLINKFLNYLLNIT